MQMFFWHFFLCVWPLVHIWSTPSGSNINWRAHKANCRLHGMKTDPWLNGLHLALQKRRSRLLFSSQTKIRMLNASRGLGKTRSNLEGKHIRCLKFMEFTEHFIQHGPTGSHPPNTWVLGVWCIFWVCLLVTEQKWWVWHVIGIHGLKDLKTNMKHKTGWWFQLLFIFTPGPYLGKGSNLTNIFHLGWKPSTRKRILMWFKFWPCDMGKSHAASSTRKSIWGHPWGYFFSAIKKKHDFRTSLICK